MVFIQPIPGDKGADQLHGVPVIRQLPMDRTRGPEVIGYGRIWPDADGPVQGSLERDGKGLCDSEPQLLHEGVSAQPTLWR